MQQGAIGEPVTADSDEGLKLLLAHIHEHPQGWNCDAARTLLKVAENKLTPMVRKAGIRPAEALTAAWELWRNDNLSSTETPWAYTAAVIRRAAGREDEAQRKMTSTQGLRRRGFTDITILTMPPGLPPGRQAESDQGAPTHPAAIAARQCLIMAGLSPHHADRVLIEMTDQLGKSGNLTATCDRLSRNSTIAAQAGLSHTQWRALVSLMLGTTRGRPGLMELVTRGHPNPLKYSYIRRASTRLLDSRRVA